MLVAFGMTFTSARASNNVTVQMTNSTQYTMTQFYASASDASACDTSNNLIAGQSLAPGQSMTINVGNADNCTFDLMALLYGASTSTRSIPATVRTER